jgi:hypothetical protein
VLPKIRRILVFLLTGGTYYTDIDIAERQVRRGDYQWRSERSIEQIEPRFRLPLWDGFLGTGNAIPFSRVQNKLCAPPHIHYPIPAAGAHTRMMRCAWNNTPVVGSGGDPDDEES